MSFTDSAIAPSSFDSGAQSTGTEIHAPTPEKVSGGIPGVSESTQPEATKDILDLDKLERFRFNGREWNPKDLKNAYLMREDYTRKTQELSEARKYADNFEHDLAKVWEDRNLLSEMKKVYPASYVAIAEKLLSQGHPQPQSAPQQSTGQMPDEIAQRLQPIEQKFAQWEKAQQEAETKKISSWLDNQFTSLSKKYPYANDLAVTALAETAYRNGEKITEATLEKLFKSENEKLKSRYDEMYKSKVEEQLTAGKKATDIGAGGGVPGQAPKQIKSFKEAADAHLKYLTGK